MLLHQKILFSGQSSMSILEQFGPIPGNCFVLSSVPCANIGDKIPLACPALRETNDRCIIYLLISYKYILFWRCLLANIINIIFFHITLSGIRNYSSFLLSSWCIKNIICFLLCIICVGNTYSNQWSWYSWHCQDRLWKNSSVSLAHVGSHHGSTGDAGRWWSYWTNLCSNKRIIATNLSWGKEVWQSV